MDNINKKQNNFSKIFATFLVVLVLFILIITFLFPVKTYAETIDTYNKIEEYAKDFVSKEVGVNVDSIIPIYDLNNEIIRYCVNYIDECGNDYGYVILNRTLNDKRGAVIEMSLGNKSQMDSLEDKYYFLDGLSYGKINGSIIKVEEQTLSLSNAKQKYKKFLDDNSDDVSGYVDTIYVGEITKDLQVASYWYTFDPITQNDLRDAGLDNGDTNGICGLTTAMNVLKYYYDSGVSKYSSLMVLNNSGNIDLATTAYRLNSGYVPSNFVYNLPSNTIRKNALNHYISTYTSLSISATKYLINLWSFFYNDITNGKIIDVRYDVNSAEGHAVLCIGAVEVSGAHYSGTKYLLVAETWHSNVRLLNFNYYSNLKGMSIKVD